ncbi:3beta-hydroxysteroid-dehydrogenase/decarboxylase isoform 2 [Leucoagaricus sp. SymC.cos]|nr:3beta-hydroxysteroid-dehydrogenase/decarboxylase isoform 2 [Leucoagaricus sp. SymC.cos]
MPALWALLSIPAVTIALALYLYHVNRSITIVPSAALKFSPQRWNDEQIRTTAARLAERPLDSLPHLPAATGRRYIVVGGSGLVGGWIILHLLARGEDPKKLRIVDIRRPVREDMLSGPPAQVGFVSADIRDIESLRTAFLAEWPSGIDNADITVFHTAATIRYFERHASLVPRSSSINVQGVENSVAAARACGATVFIFTSSASIPVVRTRFWVWPWEKHPKTFVQVANDDEATTVRPQNRYFSNYAYTKHLAERVVCEAHSPDEGFRTGCLRPGNAIFGSGGDLSAGAYLFRAENPSWVSPIIQPFTYVENASYGHLLYEKRLLDLESDLSKPDVGGQSFCIADRGDPIAYSDLYHALSLLTHGETRFPSLPPAPMLILAHLIELYYITQTRLPRLLPAMTGDLPNLQPPIFDLVTIHLNIDYSRAALSPAQGGLGYAPPWSTLEGVCQLVNDHLRERNEGQDHQLTGGGISVPFRRQTQQRVAMAAVVEGSPHGTATGSTLKHR